MKDLILLDAIQGSEAWHQARLGIPTASQFNRIVTPTGKPSGQAQGYQAELIAECLTGRTKDSFSSADMERGIELEPQARARYSLVTGNDVIEVGGVFLDEPKTVMASPDGLIPDLKRGLEIKCPRLETHIRYCLLNETPSDYVLQVQGNLWVSGYETWDFVSFCPEYTPQPILIVTVQRDEKLIKIMDQSIRAFSKTLEAHKAALEAA